MICCSSVSMGLVVVAVVGSQIRSLSSRSFSCRYCWLCSVALFWVFGGCRSVAVVLTMEGGGAVRRVGRRGCLSNTMLWMRGTDCPSYVTVWWLMGQW
ncbi:hypothetical protein RHMOL_Rhmol07G0180000 [Rhododendron molle]|uniref:Uncharacterized protein n=1 Tax=Rhododendron molle TaxID=49168 RepID=A0ACC0N321_RHOML|nr:hypothetical protein RHMOL_Rhmol07G0180000 [Rhododendron molle]